MEDLLKDLEALVTSLEDRATYYRRSIEYKTWAGGDANGAERAYGVAATHLRLLVRHYRVDS
jgi:hypothetical protein